MSMRSQFLLLGGAAALALTLTTPAMADPVMLTATLNGANENDAGDPDGSGSFSAEVDVETGDLCFVLAAEDIGDAVAAHIHKGSAGSNGKPVITIEVTGEDEDLCVAVEPAKLEPIIAAPADYYVNVHTAEFPKGAIRGQLGVSE